MIRKLMLLAAGLFLAACQQQNTQAIGQPAPAPLLYEIASADGEAQGWLFGTIHALPDGVEWRTDALTTANAKADMLIVEIAALDDSAALSRIYTRLARSPNLPPITSRVSDGNRARLDILIARSAFQESDFDRVETWAASLMLAQLANTGDAKNGVDRAMITMFEGRELREFEGARAQLSIFDQLPESEQRDLLDRVIDDIERAEDDPAALRNAWLTGDEAALIEATQTGIMADPELREALLVKRNRDWIEQLVPILAQHKLPMIAVGAGHLVGADGMPAMLRAEGYSVRRLQ